MKWENNRTSDQIEDRRASPGGGRFGGGGLFVRQRLQLIDGFDDEKQRQADQQEIDDRLDEISM